MAHLDRIRAGQLMAAAGLDAMVLLSPESFRYATGAAPGVGTMWRRAGAVAVLVPADPAVPEVAVVSDLFAATFHATSHITDIRLSPLWVESVTLEGDTAAQTLAGRALNRPETFNAGLCWQHLAAALADMGLTGGVIGVEMQAISAADWPTLATALAPAQLIDASEVVARCKMVKSPAEIVHLRTAVELAELGIAAVRDAIHPGMTRDDLAAVWAAEVTARRGKAVLTSHWEYISVGPDPWGGNAAARLGDIVKVDVGCVIAGYTSDTGRTFSVGGAPAQAREVHHALMQGFRAGRALLGPGVPLSQVHYAAQSAIRSAGLPGYSRGHFGHGLGAGLGSEEWPFISATTDVLAERGMVLAFECPFYATGLGGFIIEDQILITETGAETMNRLTVELV